MSDGGEVDSAAEIQTWLEAATRASMGIVDDLLGRNHPIAAAYRLPYTLESVARSVVSEIERVTPDGDHAVVGLALSCLTPPTILINVTECNSRLRAGFMFYGYAVTEGLAACRDFADARVRDAVTQIKEEVRRSHVRRNEGDASFADPKPSPDDDEFRSVLVCVVCKPSQVFRTVCDQVTSGAVHPEIALLLLLAAYHGCCSEEVKRLPVESQPAAVAAVLAAAFERQRPPPVLVLPQVIV